MGFWSGFFVGLVLGQVGLVFALYLTKRARDVTFNHNHWDL